MDKRQRVSPDISEFQSMKRILTFSCILFLFTSLVFAQSNRTKRVQFARGADSASYQDGIARGETLTYVLGAGQGQNMVVSITSSEDNAVFEVFAPNGSRLGSGSMTAEMDMVWQGRLPTSGDYRVVVGSTRGGSSFSSYFQIR